MDPSSWYTRKRSAPQGHRRLQNATGAAKSGSGPWQDKCPWGSAHPTSRNLSDAEPTFAWSDIRRGTRRGRSLGIFAAPVRRDNR